MMPARTLTADLYDLAGLNERSREIFRQIVESYLSTGEPVGSRNLSRLIPMALSAASVRNVMQDLEEAGLIYAPHTSAGRLPTERGLRFFVDSLMQFGELSAAERASIEAQVVASVRGRGVDDMLGEASQLLSGLSKGAGVVLAGKTNAQLKHIEFVRIEPAKALVVLVAEDGQVENRVLPIPADMPSSTLVEASNFANAHIRGLTLPEARERFEQARQKAAQELDEVAGRLVESGIACWSGGETATRQLIVRGQGNLLGDVTAMEDINRIRLLFDDLEAKRDLIDLLGRAETADGVRIFIGSENKLFSLSGSSMVVAPYHDSTHSIVGVLGVIGPTRLNYARIVPVVDHTARVLSRLLGH